MAFIPMGIKFEKHTGPAKCWKCGKYIEDDVEYYLALDMVGRPSLDDEQFIQPLPEFCVQCYVKFK
jgi:hypothetical protein